MCLALGRHGADSYAALKQTICGTTRNVSLAQLQQSAAARCPMTKEYWQERLTLQPSLNDVRPC